jgi:hypothetical protein
MLRRLTFGLSLLVVAGLASMAQADPIAVPGYSFEDVAPSVTADGGWSDSYSFWTETNPGSNGSFVEWIGGPPIFASEGTRHIGINGIQGSINAGIIPAGSFQYDVFQDIGVPLQPNMEYTMTVGIGNRNPSFTFPGNLSAFSLEVGGVPLGQGGVDASTITPGTFADSSFSFTTGATVPAGNIVLKLSNIDLGLASGGAAINARSHFDNIRLDAVPIPEPAGLTLAGLMSLGLVARRRRK